MEIFGIEGEDFEDTVVNHCGYDVHVMDLLTRDGVTPADSGGIGIIPRKIFEFAFAVVCFQLQASLHSGCRSPFVNIKKRNEYLGFPLRDRTVKGDNLSVLIQCFYGLMHKNAPKTILNSAIG